MNGEPQPELRPGLRMIGGGTFTIPAGGLVMSVDDEGNPNFELREFLVAASTWPDWLDIALEQLQVAKAARRELTEATAANDEQAENAAVQREMRAALQTISASVFALDGLYGLIRPHVKIPADELERRRRKKTGRAVWVSDAIFRVSKIHSGAQRICGPS